MTTITLNKLSGEDKKARVGKILVQEGDCIKAGEGLFHTESSKGNFLVKSEYDGIIKKLCVQEGETVALGQEIGEIEVEKSSAPPNSPQNSPQENKKTFQYTFGLAQPKKEEISCDIAILGGGPGGYVAAIRGAQLGATVVLIEKEKIGGTCLNVGCIPTKTYVKSAHLMDEICHSKEFGILTTHPALDLSLVRKRKNEVVDRLVGGIRYLLDKANVRVVQGEGKITEDGSIIVKNAKTDAVIHPGKIILATGSAPARLPIPGAELPGVLTNHEVLELTEIPKSMVIIGGGVIGMEFAMIFQSFGCKVTVVEFMDRILFNFDEDLVAVIEEACRERGIELIPSAKVVEIAEADDGTNIVTYTKGEQRKYLVGEKVLMAVGRKALIPEDAVAAFDLELNERQNGIKVDNRMRTSNDKVFAIGDVTNIIQLAHIASHQGVIAAENIMGLDSTMEYNAVPSAVFLSPEIGIVGLCEKEAAEQQIPHQVTLFPFAANGKALSQGETKGFVKILSDPEQKIILGAAVIGPGATDLIAHFSPLIKEKMDYTKLKHMILAHPTTAESIHEAILGIEGGAIHFG